MNKITCLTCRQSMLMSSFKKHKISKKHLIRADLSANKTYEYATVYPFHKSVCRQQHGFDFECYIITRFSLIRCLSYTSEWDAHAINNIPVSIKCIKKGSSIDLGCFYRNMTKSFDFYLYIGFWIHDYHKNKCVTELYRFYIEKTYWCELFYFENIKQMRTELNLISNLHEDDKKWNEYCNKYKNEFYAIQRNCKIRFKRDHKLQKRIQCSLSQRDFRKLKKDISYDFFNIYILL